MTVVRFAPSPTGYLHIGGVRTALFNYFFARNQNGKYILRIEDTDMTRSSTEMAEVILEGLKWLGIDWDEGPFYQSQRFALYHTAAMKLIEEKKAYRCFCKSETRNTSESGEETTPTAFKYDRKCANLSTDQINEKLAASVPYAIRFHIPQGKTFFKDSIHKEMTIDNNELEDFVIMKPDQSPTYHLSVVVDDNDMGITHVIRGDDHISNTFKQILLFQALGLKPPKFAHLPLILGADKKKLSKRHGETSVLEFKKKGYLPEAIINYLSQLSWIAADSKKIFTMNELIQQFNLSKLSKSSPVFDYDKLKFLNSRVIQEKDPAELLTRLEEDPDFKQKYAHIEFSKKTALITLVKPRMKTLPEFIEKFAIYLSQIPPYTQEELQKLLQTLPRNEIIHHIELLKATLLAAADKDFTASGVENLLRDCATQNGLKAADLIHPARFALTSETVSPSIFEVFEFFGKNGSCDRLQALLDYLKTAAD